MDKKALGGLIILLLLGVFGFIFWQKSQAAQVPVTPTAVLEQTIKKVDLSTQPVWVQNLKVSAKKGHSANGLDNFTLTVTGAQAPSLTYVLQYQTSNKGTQGALAMSPIALTNGSLTKIIDLGTCSTKSCVRHDGVTSVDVELDFPDSSVWTGSVQL